VESDFGELSVPAGTRQRLETWDLGVSDLTTYSTYWMPLSKQIKLDYN